MVLFLLSLLCVCGGSYLSLRLDRRLEWSTLITIEFFDRGLIFTFWSDVHYASR
jgi:hypothetical protein